MTDATQDRMARIARERHSFLTFDGFVGGRRVPVAICVVCQMVVPPGMHRLAPCEREQK